MSATTIRGTRLRRAVTGIGVTGAFAGLLLGGAPSAGADDTGTRSASAAPIGFHGASSTGNARISGTYQYWYAGKDTAGRPFYDGKFSGATARDRNPGDKYQAVLALKYDDFVGGGWRTVKNRVAVVNGSKSWSFKNKANVTAYACDRHKNNKKLINCRAWRF
ncbi:hypothetical protein [Streptomyces lasiicapitis]|uniref:hypothetical protein n=1 Tax=Streptomyces lasiicapitis TaxID=1923961 RepID=UPI003648B609